MLRHKMLWLFLVLLIFNLLGCQRGYRQQTSLNLDTYPNVLLPTPTQVTLTNLTTGSTEQNINLKKGDMGALMRVLRTGVDAKLTVVKLEKNAWQKDKALSLELSYDHASELDLMVSDTLLKLNANKVLIVLDKGMMLVDTDQGLKGFSGLQLSDEFVKFMQGFTINSSFPLPPAITSDHHVEQLPLAKPGENQLEFLPPAKPNQSTGR